MMKQNDFRKRLSKWMFLLLLFGLSSTFMACEDEEEIPAATGMSETFTLFSVANPSINGTAKFEELEDGSTQLTIQLSGTPSGGVHPAHIHDNTAAESGNIAVSLNPVDGSTGKSVTRITKKDDGSPITYTQLLAYNGYINVHLSATELATIVAQGDIGNNALTGETKVYPLGTAAVPGISGTATFAKRKNGQTLVTLALTGTPNGGVHPAHIHLNSAAEGGGIAVDLTNVNGTTGISRTNVKQLNNGTAINYDGLLNFNGYINVHLSATQLATIVAQGDIGANELTGESKTYNLMEKAVAGIMGTAKFEKRKSGKTLVTLMLQGTPNGGVHPAHIHFNSAAEGGGIAVDLNSVNGTTGMSKTTIRTLKAGGEISYDQLLNYNGYINVHLSMENLATIVAQGDIGANELTGNSKTYPLATKDIAGISGTAKFEERKNGTTLITIALTGTPAGASHPAHIHNNNVATGGGIAVTLNSVNGTTGMSMTQVTKRDDNTAITYTQLIGFNGYINVHLSMEQLAVIAAQGNIGSNVP